MLQFYYTSIRTLLKKMGTDYIDNTEHDDYVSEWDLKQLFHQISLSLNIAKGIKDGYIQKKEPISKNIPTLQECDIFIDVLHVFSKYLDDNEKQFESSPLKLYTMLKTTIFVQNDTVVLVSGDVNIINMIKKECNEKNYKFEGKKVEIKMK
jgi:hypothetical protein